MPNTTPERSDDNSRAYQAEASIRLLDSIAQDHVQNLFSPTPSLFTKGPLASLTQTKPKAATGGADHGEVATGAGLEAIAALHRQEQAHLADVQRQFMACEQPSASSQTAGVALKAAADIARNEILPTVDQFNQVYRDEWQPWTLDAPAKLEVQQKEMEPALGPELRRLNVAWRSFESLMANIESIPRNLNLINHTLVTRPADADQMTEGDAVNPYSAIEEDRARVEAQLVRVQQQLRLLAPPPGPL